MTIGGLGRRLQQLTRQAAEAPFSQELLEVDEPLWGGFWSGDVLEPGYRLPAGELAWLRAVRLDSTWPDSSSPASFLADLYGAVLQPSNGIWTLVAADQPCVVFAAPAGLPHNPTLLTVVWYCATTGRLHAGYRATPDRLNLQAATRQRRLEFVDWDASALIEVPAWLVEAARQTESLGKSLAARLDAAILRIRAGLV